MNKQRQIHLSLNRNYLCVRGLITKSEVMIHMLTFYGNSSTGVNLLFTTSYISCFQTTEQLPLPWKCQMKKKKNNKQKQKFSKETCLQKP